MGRLSAGPILSLESSNNSLRQNSEDTVTQELTFAAHLGLPAIMFTLTTDRCCNIARLIHNRVVQGVCYQVCGSWLVLCMWEFFLSFFLLFFVHCDSFKDLGKKLFLVFSVHDIFVFELHHKVFIALISKHSLLILELYYRFGWEYQCRHQRSWRHSIALTNLRVRMGLGLTLGRGGIGKVQQLSLDLHV